jgi:uncharacterized protein (TIGR00369 family)
MPGSTIADIRRVNERSAFNTHCGFEAMSAADGRAELAVSWRDEFGQSSGYLHAGLIAGLIDTACGYAAGSVVGPVMASHFSVNCMRPGIGSRFIARARVVKAGRTQVFTACDLFALAGADETLIATGETIMVPASASRSNAPALEDPSGSVASN